MSSASSKKKQNGWDFKQGYNFEQHLENKGPPENDREILESHFVDEMTVEEVTQVGLQDARVSVFQKSW